MWSMGFKGEHSEKSFREFSEVSFNSFSKSTLFAYFTQQKKKTFLY